MAAFTLMRDKEIRSGIPVPEVTDDDVNSEYSGGLRSWRDPRQADSDSDGGAPPSGLVSEQAGYALRRNSSVFERLKAFATVLTPTNTKSKAKGEKGEPTADKGGEPNPEPTEGGEAIAGATPVAKQTRRDHSRGAVKRGGLPRGRAKRGGRGRRVTPVRVHVTRPGSSRSVPRAKTAAARTRPATGSRKQRGAEGETDGNTSADDRRGSLHEDSTASGEARRRTAYNFPKWLAKRQDFESLKQDQAHCGPVFVRQALTTPGYKRRDQEVATLVRWLRQYNLFKHLHDRQLSVIARALTLSRVLPGQTLYPEKRVAYFVLTGKAHVSRPGGQPLPVMPGQCLGARFWWSVVANGIQHRTTRLGRRMSQILLEAEAVNSEPTTVIDPRDAMVTSDDVMDRHTEQLHAAVERVHNRRGSIMGAELNDDELPEDTKAVASYSVPAKVTNHKQRSRFGKLDLWVDQDQADSGKGGHRGRQRAQGGQHGQPRVSTAPHGSTATGGPTSPQPRISVPTPTSMFGDGASRGRASTGCRRARTPGQLLTSDIAPLSPRSYKEAQARERRNRRRSFFDSSFATTAAPESEGGSPNGLELVRLSMGDYVEALAADKKRSQKRIMEFLGTVGYFQSWTASRLLVVAGLLEEREIPAGDFVFRQGDAVNGLCILMTGKCKLMKRVRVERTHRWPVSKKSWSVQKKKYDWNVEVKLLLPKAIIGEESTLISKKHRLALVSNYFSNAFVAQGQTALPTRGGVRPLDNVAEAALSGVIRGDMDDDNQPVVDRFKELADQLMQHHTEAGEDAGDTNGVTIDSSATRDLDAEAAYALRQAAKALEAVLAKKRPYSVQAVEDSVVLFLRPEHFACLYHTALMPKLRKLARVQATADVVREAEEQRRKALTEKRKLRDQLVGERYKRKIEHHPGDPSPPPPQGPLLNVPRTDDALNTKARVTANDGLLEAYLNSFNYESRAVRDIRESEEAEEWERRRSSATSAHRTPVPRPVLSASEAALMPNPYATPITARGRPASGTSRRLRLGSARPASVQKLSAGWGARPATGGWDQYMHVSPNRVVVRMSSTGGARPRTSPATVVVGAFPARPGSPGFSPKSLMSKQSFTELRLRSLASNARAHSPPMTGRRNQGKHTARSSNPKSRMAMRKRTQDRNRRKPQPSPDARRGSAYAQAMKAGKIVPSLSDLALVGKEAAPVERAQSPPVDARNMRGAAGHRLWEHTNMDPVAEGVGLRLALPYPTDVFQRQARVNAVEAARRKAEEAAVAAQQVAKRAASPPTSRSAAIAAAAAAKRANGGRGAGGSDNGDADASSGDEIQPDDEALLGQDHEPNEVGVAKRFVDDSVYDDVGWWATRTVADRLNSGAVRGDTVETVEQLQKRLNVKLRWRPVKQFSGGASRGPPSPSHSPPPTRSPTT